MSTILVIGGGPAGEAAARFAAKQKARVSLVEKEHLGGLCLNRGCIPSKTLLAFGKKLAEFRRSKISGFVPAPQKQALKTEVWREMKKEKERVILSLRTSLEKTVKAGGIETIVGEAKFISPGEAQISSSGGVKTLAFDRAVIAAGSSPIYPKPLDGFKADLLDSDKILELEEAPESLIIVGGGAVGCEFACLFNELGTTVTIVEKTAGLLPGEDEQIVNALRKSFESRGIKIIDSVTVSDLSTKDGLWEMTLSDKNKISAEKIAVCAGRKANCDSLALEKAAVKFSPKGIEVDSGLRTTNPKIFAAGDVTGLSLLAHAGSVQGEVAAANALDGSRTYDGSLVPRCLYTWPEVASVGLWLRDAQTSGLELKGQRFFFQASGRALAEGDTEGFIQIVSDAKSDRIMGAQIIGPHATEMIHIISVALRKEMTRAEMREVIFAHPTLSEGIRIALEK